VKPVTSLFIMQRNNGESVDHVAEVMIFPKENKNDALLTMLAIASSRAANRIPIFLTPKPVLVALGNARPDFLEASFLQRALQQGKRTAELHQFCVMLLIHLIPEVPLYPLGHTKSGSSAHRRLCTPMLIHDP